MGPEPGLTDLTRLDLGADLGYEVRIDAEPATVWVHWTAPDLLVRWMGKVATLEPRPGGIFRLEYGSGDVTSGRFVEVDALRRLAFTWGWEGDDAAFPPDSTTIELDFEAVDAGRGTLLRLQHRGVPTEVRSDVDVGWGYFLPRLVDAVEAEDAA